MAFVVTPGGKYLRALTPGGKYLRALTPGFVYHPACARRLQLAAVKQQIYHPCLPTFRAMQRDDMMHKLSDEHCRTTTSCTRRQFQEATINPLKPATLKLHCIDITDTGGRVKGMYGNMEDIQANTEVWSQYRDKLVSQARQQQAHHHHQYSNPGSNFHFDGCAVRYFKSAVRDRQIKAC